MRLGLIEKYFQKLLEIINASPVTRTSSVTFDKRSSVVGFIRGTVYFIDGTMLHFRELITIGEKISRDTYAYHYQQQGGDLIFRYDKAPHFPKLPNAPHHKHIGIAVEPVIGSPPDLDQVLKEIEDYIKPAALSS